MDSLAAKEMAFDEFITNDTADALFEKVSGELSDVLSLSEAAFNFGWECGVSYERFSLLTYGEIVSNLSDDLTNRRPV